MNIERLRIALMVATSFVAACASTPQTQPTVPQQQRAAMAAAHERMATCLRSDATLDACRQEMRGQCMSMGASHCQMMDRGKMRMHKGGQPVEQSTPSQHEH